MVHCMDMSEQAQAQAVADEVRRRRQQRGWTLDVAAGRLGVSRRLLAQLEAGQANPSLSTLLSVAAGFDISLVELLAGGDKPSITLQADNAAAPVLWTGTNGGEGRLLVGSDPLELWHWTLAPGDERESDAHRSGSREVLMVTAGAVTVSVGSGDPVVVRRGQSALFRADEPHSYRNDGRGQASFVLAVHEPSGHVAGGVA
jgi:transcriptional regulator with XRE-family HTH domain